MLQLKKCPQCSVDLEIIGRRDFRTGGSTGLKQFLLGDFAELGERKIPLEVWFCPHCRRVELYIPEDNSR